jgi:hypothetical protein
MKANKNKFVAILCGALRRSPPPTNLEGTAALIQWLKNQEYTKILGIPFWKQGNEDQFWTDL